MAGIETLGSSPKERTKGFAGGAGPGLPAIDGARRAESRGRAQRGPHFAGYTLMLMALSACQSLPAGQGSVGMRGARTVQNASPPAGVAPAHDQRVRASLSSCQTESSPAEALQQRVRDLARKSGWSQAFAAWGGDPDQDSVPRPQALSAAEWQSVLEGWTVSHALDFELEGRKYVGGAAFQIIAADSDHILATLTDADQLPSALPQTHDAVQIEAFEFSPRKSLRGKEVSSQGVLPSEVAIELHQGNAIVQARYTVRLARTDAHTLRFVLDDSRKHDIRDARGFFTAHQLNETHSLVSVFVGVDLGGGLASKFLQRSVQKAALSTPAHIRKYVEPIVSERELARAETTVGGWRRIVGL